MESFFSRYKNALVLIAVLLVQVVGVAIQVRRPLPKEHAQPDAGGVRLIRYWAISLVSPPERFVHWLGESILGVWDNYLDLVHVRQQNKNLEGELRRLRIEQGGIVEDARQGQRLQQLLSFEEKYIYKTVPAQIIGSSGSEQSRILSINKGSKDGIGVDMPVITPDGIVGRIREVFPHTSQVLEITDPTSGAGVMLATTRIRGILRGNTLGQPQVINVLPDDRIKPGEKVVTSGGDQIFPRGLAVGTVDRVIVDPDRDPLVDVLIHPAANLSQLEEVLVVTNTGSETPPQQRLDMLQSAAAANAEQLKASEVLAERLPSRIDPDAPQQDNAGSDEAANAEGEGIARPLRPPAALRPDRFTPNTTPAAAGLTPGARAAAQSEGSGSVAVPRPRPVTQPGSTAATPGLIKPGSVTPGSTIAGSTGAVVKKKPELAPGDGSRPPSTVASRPVSPGAGEGVATPRTSGITQTSTTRPANNSGTVPGSAAGTPVHKPATAASGQAPGSVSGSTTAASPRLPSVPTVPPSRPVNGALAGTGAAHPATGTTNPRAGTPNSGTGTANSGTGTANAGTAGATAGTPADRLNPTDSSGSSAPRTRVVVDGPLPSAQRKATTPSTTTPVQRPPIIPGQRPANAPNGTATRPSTPQRKGPELVPDDGSRPPPTMLPSSKPPSPRPAPQQPTQSQPPGGR